MRAKNQRDGSESQGERRPGYVDLARRGELSRRAREATARLGDCRLCPRACAVNRREGERGFCKGGELPKVSSYGPHFGEEAPLVGRYGSGTIFFAGCNLGCLFCQNYDISHGGIGAEVTIEELARMMLELQKRGCHNLNFVTPTHFVPQILAALEVACARGLSIPLVYNSGGYEEPSSLGLLEGVFDIYMPDVKFLDPEVAWRLCRARDYPEKVKAAVLEMHRQVGDLVVDPPSGLAVRGLLVRHLVLPGGLAGTREVMRFLAREVSRNTYVNVMAQYYPAHLAWRCPPLDRSITAGEYRQAVEVAREEGITRLDR